MKRLKVDLVDEHFYRPEVGSWHKVPAMTTTIVKVRKSLPANMPAMEKERNGTIIMLLCSKLLS